MSEKKPSIPKGTRDFIPAEVAKREYIFNIIRDTFRLFGYQAIETPAMENLSSLLGKYGEEGDKLLFKILNSGDFLNELNEARRDTKDPARIGNLICEKGLRYDLTVPFARFIVQHRNEISFPFKRFQIQPVWRADRPQKGRYREFYQCDADTIGSNSLLNEAELIKIIDIIFNKIKIPVTIKLNNRKILAGIAETIGESDRFTAITTAMDKFEKIGKNQVISELKETGISSSAISRLLPVLEFTGSTEDKMEFLRSYLKGSETGLKGLEEVKTVNELAGDYQVKNEILLDLSLARGLNYYTGIIIEVKANNVSMGSICGGGRYDNLTGFFGLPGISGVGISFGADRIYDVLEQLKLFPSETKTLTRVLFINFGNNEVLKILPLTERFRNEGVNSELYPDPDKIKKQLSYADNNKIPFVVLAGEDELSKGLITLKNMATGEQHQMVADEAIRLVKGI